MSTDFGTLVEIDGHPTLRFVRTLRAPVARVWRAATDEQEMTAWFPARVQGEREVGAPLRFLFDDEAAPTFDGEVLEWDPPRVFAFRWNQDVLRIELAAEGDGTRLVFSQTLVGRGEAARNGAGWHLCLDALATHLGAPPAAREEWPDLFVDYVRGMGPPLARRDGETLVFERTHHLPAEDLRELIDGWDAPGAATWAVTAEPHGSSYTVRVSTDDSRTAARWHAALVEFDMYAASGQRISVEDQQFVHGYRRLLA